MIAVGKLTGGLVAALLMLSPVWAVADQIQSFDGKGPTLAEACGNAKMKATASGNTKLFGEIIEYGGCECSPVQGKTADQMLWFCSVDVTFRK